MDDTPPDLKLLTLRDVLARLSGRMGRTKLLAHLRVVPRHADGPTHRRNGRKILFTEADFRRLLDSLAPDDSGGPAAGEWRRGAAKTAPPSADQSFRLAQERLARFTRRPTKGGGVRK